MVEPPERRASRGRILFFMAVLHMMCHGLLTLITPLYDAMQADFGTSTVAPITGIATWMMLSFAVATLGAGALVDRVPSKQVVGYGLLVHGLGLIGLAHAETLPVANFWAVVTGIGSAGYHPAAARLIVGLFPEAVGRAMGLVGIGAGLGFYAGPRFAGWRAEAAGWAAPGWEAAAWRAPLQEAGVLAIVVTLAYWFFTVEPVLPAEPTRSGQPLSPPTRRDKLMLIMALGLLGLALIPRDFAGTGFEVANSLMLQRGFGYSVGVVGSLLAYKGLLSLVTNPLFAALSDRGNRLAWWGSMLALSTLFGVAVPWLPPPAAQVALVLHGMFLLANFPIFESALVERVPSRLRGRAYAVILAVVGVFSAYAPKFVGQQVDALYAGPAGGLAVAEFRGLYLALALLMAVSLVGWPLLEQLRRRGDRLVQ